MRVNSIMSCLSRKRKLSCNYLQVTQAITKCQLAEKREIEIIRPVVRQEVYSF